ncbi:hypothetical protein BCON_0702g00020 [Botryotinia convoluta]|uniref:Uncharacterized protein n=1 Tax=Botryotinia convoluta TaxID=54673 RepID=A0A4Z1H411_9HELO|nr:hypothetical protein BCON_0702g00020 [Botryotinia convoluta]
MKTADARALLRNGRESTANSPSVAYYKVLEYEMIGSYLSGLYYCRHKCFLSCPSGNTNSVTMKSTQTVMQLRPWHAALFVLNLINYDID